MPGPKIATHRLRQGETQMDMSMRTYKRNAQEQVEHPDQNLALYTYRKNPSVWTYGLEKKYVQMVLRQCFF